MWWKTDVEKVPDADVKYSRSERRVTAISIEGRIDKRIEEAGMMTRCKSIISDQGGWWGGSAEEKA